MPERRIETKTSRTAEMTCLSRAASFLESAPLFKSNDWVALKMLPRHIQLGYKLRPFRMFLLKAMAPEGIYEYVIARTKYIDALFDRAASGGFSQILFFGAGFDSRGIRFESRLKGMKVFELDAAATQTAKRRQYERRGIAVPANVVFVAVNFEKESAEEKLVQAGFSRGAKTLVVAEGVTQYLKPEAAYAMFGIIRDAVGKDSLLVFDYAHASVFRGGDGSYGEARMIKAAQNAGESWQFGLEEADVEPLLGRYGFELIDRKSPRQLEETYFKDEKGNIAARVNATQSVVTARKS